MAAQKTFLDLVELCDSFPYDSDFASTYYKLYLPQDASPHGFLHPDVVAKMPWTPLFHVDHALHRVDVLPNFSGSRPSAAVGAAFANLVSLAITQDVFTCLGGRHSEAFPIPGAAYPVQLERFSCSLFGIATRGAHLTAYTRSRTTGELHFWVPRRSQNVGTWKGMLDSTVAGGVAAHESPFENMVREAAEEASLPDHLVLQRTVAVGVLTYMGVSKGENGWESGMALPDVVYVYDLELDDDVVPRPCDDEVKEFYLMGVEEVKERMLKGEFKPNCAVVMLDFFVRHGLLTHEGEQHYAEIVQRMHRRLPFPLVRTSDGQIQKSAHRT